MDKYAWSFNEEYYNSIAGDEIAVVIENLFKDNEFCEEFEKNDSVVVFMGEATYYEDTGSDIYYYMIEYFQERAFETVDEFSEGYLDNIPKESEQLLKKELDKAWNKFINSGDIKARFFKCSNIKKLKIYPNGEYIILENN
ncbi:MAG: hypothetical protein ACRC0S_08050 [Fusobacteriaceae bacterium]